MHARGMSPVTEFMSAHILARLTSPGAVVGDAHGLAHRQGDHVLGGVVRDDPHKGIGAVLDHVGRVGLLPAVLGELLGGAAAAHLRSADAAPHGSATDQLGLVCGASRGALGGVHRAEM